MPVQRPGEVVSKKCLSQIEPVHFQVLAQKMSRTLPKNIKKVAHAESPASNVLRPPHKRARQIEAGAELSVAWSTRTPPAGVSSADIDTMTSSLAKMDMTTPIARTTGKRQQSARKKLVFVDEVEETRTTRRSSMPQWSDDEVRFLVQFVMQHTDGISWPTTHDPLYWDDAGKFLQTQSSSLYQRSGILVHGL